MKKNVKIILSTFKQPVISKLLHIKHFYEWTVQICSNSCNDCYTPAAKFRSRSQHHQYDTYPKEVLQGVLVFFDISIARLNLQKVRIQINHDLQGSGRGHSWGSTFIILMQPMLKNYKKKNPQISQSRFLKVKVLALKKIIF